ncbi:MAG: hypothetical protein IBX68_02955 [Dehalococcoidia bacterium]|nr:hypothetical protein [Dehalococcoidia bacterium]
MSTGKVLLLVFGILVVILATGLFLAGGFVIWMDRNYTDEEGFLSTPDVEVVRESRAVTTRTFDIEIDPDIRWTGLGTVKIEAENNQAGKEIFIGIGEDADVRAYLSGVNRDEITRLSLFPTRISYRNVHGNVTPDEPGMQNFWISYADGAGAQRLEWDPEDGRFILVVMNSDASAGLDVDVSAGVRIPRVLFWIGVALVAGGVLVLAGGGVMIYFGIRREPGRAA